MARPRKEGMEYFPHDTDAVNDEKIEPMRALFGNDGYAFYFILLERIYRTDDAELDLSKMTVKSALISKVAVTRERFDEMLAASFEIGLFDGKRHAEDGVLTSQGIKKRFMDVKSMREKWRRKKENKVDNEEKKEVFPGENVDDNYVFSPEKTREETGESKGNKTKLNQIYITQFERFWNIYPNKKGKSTAQKKWISYAEEIDIEKVLDGTQKYITFCKATERPFKDGSTFVNQKAWDDDWTVPSNKVRHLPQGRTDISDHKMRLQQQMEERNEYTGSIINY